MTDEQPHLQPESPPLAPVATRQVPPSPEPPKPSPPKFTGAPIPTTRSGGPSEEPLPFRRIPFPMYPGEERERAISPRMALAATVPLNSNAPCGIAEAKALGIPIGPPVDYNDPRYEPVETSPTPRTLKPETRKGDS